MTFDQETAAIRFGTGLSPLISPPTDQDQMFSWLAGPDEAAKRYPIASFQSLQPMLLEMRGLRRRLRRTKGKDDAAKTALHKLKRQVRLDQIKWFRASVARRVTASDGFRERLVSFWGDHFTVVAKRGLLRHAVTPYVEDAIRPHVTGRFAGMLKAVVLHPMMLFYLDQVGSVGPHSPAAKRRKRGLNENLARELLELHTVGVDASYDQKDVRELAKLLTGLSYRPGKGFVFVPKMAEPGAKTVLGKEYGGARPGLGDVLAFLEDVALRPETAHHLARELAAYFISDSPDKELVDQLAEAYSRSGGDLMVCYRVLLGHDSAWETPDMKVKQPFDFLASSLRALGTEGAQLERMNPKNLLRTMAVPLAHMGQPWERPAGPNGWDETAEDWITPQGLAERIQWAMTMPRTIMRTLPDPRVFVETALQSRASPELRFAAASAERRESGVGIVLASPAFQRF